MKKLFRIKRKLDHQEVKREFTSDIARFLHLKPILKMDGFRIGFYNYL